MGRFLFTTLLTNDLGVPVRCLPIALELKKRGHEVAFCNPMAAASRFIEEAGVSNLPIEMSARPPAILAPMSPEFRNLDDMLNMFGHLDEQFIEDSVQTFTNVINDFATDVVVDSFMPTACIAARASGKPLATIIQADLHPTSKGFMWWKDEPNEIPSPVAALNAVLSNHGLDPVSSSSELMVGDLTLCAGTPETDPVPHAPDVVHIGPMFGSQMQAPLPAWIDEFAGEKPLIWVYCGNPRYRDLGPDIPGVADSIVILRAAFEALADQDLGVIVTSAFHERPEELPPPPGNFREADFLPGLSLARRCDLAVHHGGHGTCMTAAFAGTPALIVPTMAERESNARRFSSLGVAEMQLPTVDENDEKHISSAAFGENIQKMLADSSYRTKAAALSKRMGEYGGPGEIAERIEALL